MATTNGNDADEPVIDEPVIDEQAINEQASDKQASDEEGQYLPSVILCEPQMGENIGAAARAMKNCGLRRLHIVNPRDGWPNAAAVSMASGGSDVLDSASIHETLGEAASSYTMIAATTARRRGVVKPSLTPDEAAAVLIRHAREGGKTALLFGPERSGLDNDAVALADILITVPLNPAFASLNLGQAVLLMSWVCRREWLLSSPPPIKPDDALAPANIPASAGDKAFFFDTLERALADGGFFTSPDMQPVVMRNIMSMFQRAALSEQDVRTLHGMVKAISRSDTD